MSIPDGTTSRLRVFLAVLDAGGFTAAAEQLHLSQQAVSATMTRLETDLGVRLLHRTTRTCAPTAAGAAFAERARDVVAAWDDAVLAAQTLDRVDRGVLRVGAMAGAALELTEPILEAFAALEPDAVVELEPHLYDDPSAGLRAGTTDVALLRPPMAEDGLVLHALLTEPRVILVFASHPLAAREHVRLDELRPFPAARPAGPDERWNAFWSADADPATSLPVTTLESALELVASGRAWAVAPVGWTRFHARVGLRALTSPDLVPSTLSIGRRHGERNPLARRFIVCASQVASARIDLVPAAAAPDRAPA